MMPTLGGRDANDGRLFLAGWLLATGTTAYSRSKRREGGQPSNSSTLTLSHGSHRCHCQITPTPIYISCRPARTGCDVHFYRTSTYVAACTGSHLSASRTLKERVRASGNPTTYIERIYPSHPAGGTLQRRAWWCVQGKQEILYVVISRIAWNFTLSRLSSVACFSPRVPEFLHLPLAACSTSSCCCSLPRRVAPVTSLSGNRASQRELCGSVAKMKRRRTYEAFF